MPEVQNVGAVDYSKYQPEMYQAQEAAQVPMDINSGEMPIAYDDPIMAEKRSAASSMKGLAIAGVIGAVVGGLLTYKFAGTKGSSAAKEAVEKELNELKNSEAVKNYEKVKEAFVNVEKEVQGAQKFCWYKPKTWGTATLVSKIKGLLKPARENLDKFTEETKKVVDEASGEVKKAAEEGKKAAEDAAK